MKIEEVNVTSWSPGAHEDRYRAEASHRPSRKSYTARGDTDLQAREAAMVGLREMVENAPRRFEYEGKARIDDYHDGNNLELLDDDGEWSADFLTEIRTALVTMADDNYSDSVNLGRIRITVEQIIDPHLLQDKQPQLGQTNGARYRSSSEPPCSCGTENNQHAPGCTAWGGMKIPGGN